MQRATHVLFVNPCIHHSDVQEVGERARTRRSHHFSSEVLVASRSECVATFVRDLPPLREHFGAATAPPKVDFVLVELTDWILHIRQVGGAVRCWRLAVQAKLRRHQVRERVLHRPAGALGHGFPLRLRKRTTELVDRVPDTGQHVDEVGWSSHGAMCPPCGWVMASGSARCSIRGRADTG